MLFVFIVIGVEKKKPYITMKTKNYAKTVYLENLKWLKAQVNIKVKFYEVKNEN